MLTLRRCLVALFFVALAASRVAAAPAAPSVFLEELTWTELRDAIRAGKTTVIVPVGGTEQSGPHIVLGKHNVRVKVLAGRIATSLGNALVAPVIAYVPEGSIDPPAGHMRFAGTISIPEAAFETTLEYAARSFRAHGFRDIVLIGDHGGYQKSLAKVAAKLDLEWAASPVRVHAVEEYYRAADRGFAEILRKHGLTDAEIGSARRRCRHRALARARRAARAQRAPPRRQRARRGRRRERRSAPRQRSSSVVPASMPSSRAPPRRSSATSRAIERRDPSSIGAQRALSNCIRMESPS